MRMLRLFFTDRSLWYKLTFLSVLPTILVALVIVLLVIGSVERNMLLAVDKKAEALLDLSRLSISHPLVVYNKNLLDNFVDGLSRIRIVDYAMVVDSSDNRILAHTDHSFDGRQINPLPAHAASTNTNSTSQAKNRLSENSNNSFETSTPILVEEKQYASLHIGFTFEEVHRQMVSVKQKIALAALLVAGLGALLALLVAKVISTPLHGLANQARLAGRGDFDQSLAYTGRDTIGQLVNAFNDMLEDIRIKQMQLQAVNTIADSVYHSLDLQSVASNAVETMMRYSRSPEVALFTINDRLEQLELFHAKGFGEETIKKASVLPLDGSLTGLAVRRRQVVVSTDLAADNRLDDGARMALSKEEMQSVLSIPLLAMDQVLGAMNLIFKEKYVLSDSENETLMSIGKTIGLALENARQMNRLQQKVREHRQSEKALRESEDKYRNLVERANDGILIIQDGLIRFANPSALVMSGETGNDLVGQPFVKYLHPSERVKIAGLYEHRMGGASVTSIYETIITRKDGADIHAEINAGRISYLDQPADLVFVRDITERKQSREALKQAYEQLEVKVVERTAELAVAKERAEESDRLKSAFLAAMSHELRTPLNSIIGFSGIILQKLVGPLNDEQVKQLSMVQDSAQHLLSLINDILDLSKIEAGQLNVALKPFDMRALIKKVAASISPLAEKKGLRLNIDIASGVGSITSDSRRVEQVLLNLLSNGVKFTEKGEVTIRCEAHGKWLTTIVRDTGIGIAQQDLAKLFIAFQQVETGLARRYEGSGLGLSICRKLLQLLGGSIQAHSDGQGKGATFTFTIPTGER